MESDQVSKFLGLPESEDSMDISPHHTMEDNIIENYQMQEGVEVSQQSVPTLQPISYQQAMASVSNPSTNNGDSLPCKTTLIATSILQNGNVIYEPIEDTDTPTTTMVIPSSAPPVNQAISNPTGSMPNPVTINSSDWGNFNILQDIKTALESQMGILKAGGMSTPQPIEQKDLSHNSEVSAQHSVATSDFAEPILNVIKQLAQKPQHAEGQIDPQPQAIKQLSPVGPLKHMSTDGTTPTRELSQNTETTTSPKELSQNIDATTSTRELSQNTDTTTPTRELSQNIDATTSTIELSHKNNTDGKSEQIDNVITLIKPGIQVCTLEFDILPVIGTLYVVNNDHNLVKVIYEPNKIYQTDSKGILHRIGLQQDT
jgi:hypothetical protein